MASNSWCNISIVAIFRSGKTFTVIINEPKGIAEEDVRRMGIPLFVIFLLALPAQTPFALDEDWDSDIIYGFDEIALVEYDFDNWSAEYEITITNLHQ